jgi:hypothetical protein
MTRLGTSRVVPFIVLALAAGVPAAPAAAATAAYSITDLGSLAAGRSSGVAEAAGADSGCTAQWTGLAGNEEWGDAQNWSPKKVPGPDSEVCNDVLRAIVNVPSDVTIRSFNIMLGATIIVEAPRFTVTGTLQGATGEFLLSPGTGETTTLTAGRIDNLGEVAGTGTSVITSPRFGISTLDVLSGTTTLTDPPTNLSGTTFTGGGIFADGVLRIPSDIDTLDGFLFIGAPPAEIQDADGNNALAHLSAVGNTGSIHLPNGTLTVDGDVTVSGSGASIDLGGGNREYGETGGTLAVQGTLALTQGATATLANSRSKMQASSIHIGAGSSVDSRDGTLDGPVVNDGLLDGSASIDGSYAQGGTGTLQVTAASNTQAAEVVVNGTASFGGTLEIDTLEAPDPGTSFTLMSFDSAAGSFSTTQLGFTVKRESTSLVAIATPQVAVTPVSNAPGATEQFSIADFASGETVSIHLDSTGSPPLASMQVSSDGQASGSFTVPSSAAAGKHRVVAVGGSSHRSAVTSLTIT